MRGATLWNKPSRIIDDLFQSTHPMRGATLYTLAAASSGKDFNPRTPCGVRPDTIASYCSSVTPNFNPRTPCGVRRCNIIAHTVTSGISIHAPHAGCDRCFCLTSFCVRISIHAPHAGCDVINWEIILIIVKFQSTHPMRGATHCACTFCHTKKFQSTHPMRGATSSTMCVIFCLRFQSTHPMRGATRFAKRYLSF